jgi:predicted GNAT superfamily acetyltransferase
VSIDAKKASEKLKPKYRPPRHRPALDFRLIEWLKLEHFSDPLRAVRPPHLILSQTQRLTLTRANPMQIQLPSDITSLLNETPEWADEWSDKIFNVIHKYDTDLTILLNHRGTKRKRN